jgi:hypothetical protein
MFKSTLFSAAGGTINTSGGSSAGNAGGNGRYVVNENSSAVPNYGTRVGASELFFSGQAARDVNPFIEIFGTMTHNIVDLRGGADVYGLMSTVFSDHSALANVRDNAPAGAIAAVTRLSVGPNGDDYLGHDMLVMINLTEVDLPNPRLGIVGGFSSFTLPLLERGFANNLAFGGSGAVELDQLPAGRVYATLASTTDFSNLFVNVAMAGKEVHGIQLGSAGDLVYILGTPGDFDFDGDVDGRDFLTWQRNPSIGDLADWQANYGVGALSALSIGTAAADFSVKGASPVPEPTCCVLYGIFMILTPHRRVLRSPGRDDRAI